MNTKHLLLSLLALLGSTTLHAYDAYIGGIYYNFSGTSAEVVGSAKNVEDLTIPNTVYYNATTYNVTSIAANAFHDCEDLVEIVIPENITSIATNAFSGDTKLESVWIKSNTIAQNYLLKDIFGTHVTEYIFTDGVTRIGNFACKSCTALEEVWLGNSVTGIGVSSFYGCTNLATISFSENLNNIAYNDEAYLDDELEGDAFEGTAWFNNQPNGLVYAGNVAYKYKGAMPANTQIILRDGTLGIGGGAFLDESNLTSITLPNSVTYIGMDAFRYSRNLTTVTILKETPISISPSAFQDIAANATLYVPAGSKSAYQLADYWNEFNEIVELPVDVTIGSTGYATYCSDCDLDFSGVSGLKAYIASGFSPSTGKLVLTSVEEVPAGEGLYLVGEEGTYEVPTTTTDMLYSNLLKGVTTATTISPTEGSYTNFILSTGSYGVGFYTLSSSGELAAGKAYLQLPTASVSNVKAISLAFDDDDPTALQEIEDYTTAKDIYNLQGQKVSAPRSGLYIINGKKVAIK